MPQGDPCSPLVFTSVLDLLLSDVSAKCMSEGRGFLCRRERGEEDDRYHVMVFADDICADGVKGR